MARPPLPSTRNTDNLCTSISLYISIASFLFHFYGQVRYSFSCESIGVLALSCSPRTHRAPVSALRISARSNASRFPACTSSQLMEISVPSGAGRRNVMLSDRLTPPTEKCPPKASSRVDVHTSISVVAHPPCRFPRPLHISGATVAV